MKEGLLLSITLAEKEWHCKKNKNCRRHSLFTQLFVIETFDPSEHYTKQVFGVSCTLLLLDWTTQKLLYYPMLSFIVYF